MNVYIYVVSRCSDVCEQVKKTLISFALIRAHKFHPARLRVEG